MIHAAVSKAAFMLEFLIKMLDTFSSVLIYFKVYDSKRRSACSYMNESFLFQICANK